jgi:hypothetical protein
MRIDCLMGTYRRKRSNDVSTDGKLVPADMTLLWRQYLEGIKEQVTPLEAGREWHVQLARQPQRLKTRLGPLVGRAIMNSSRSAQPCA